MKKYALLSPLVFSGSLLCALTVGAQSHEFPDSETPSSSAPSTLPAPVEKDVPSPPASVESSPPSQSQSETHPASDLQQTLVSSATVVGITVKNAQGETIGDIQEIMIDPDTGKVAYAIVTHSGQWGLGKQKSFAVPWEALKVAFNQTEVVVELESDKLSLPSHIELSQRQ